MTRKVKARRHAEPGPLIRLFVEVAMPILRERFIDNRCLNATRVCLEVMSALHVRVLPVSVFALASNKVWVDKLQAAGRMPTGAELPGWIADGAWSIGIDTRDESNDAAKNAWAGHLVAVVQDHLVDCSAIQMSRPHKNMALPDIFVGHVTTRFLKGKDSVTFQSGGDGAFLSYRLRDDVSWVDAAGFLPSKHNMEVAAEITNDMAVLLGRKEVFSPKANPI